MHKNTDGHFSFIASLNYIYKQFFPALKRWPVISSGDQTIWPPPGIRQRRIPLLFYMSFRPLLCLAAKEEKWHQRKRSAFSLAPFPELAVGQLYDQGRCPGPAYSERCIRGEIKSTILHAPVVSATATRGSAPAQTMRLICSSRAIPLLARGGGLSRGAAFLPRQPPARPPLAALGVQGRLGTQPPLAGVRGWNPRGMRENMKEFFQGLTTKAANLGRCSLPQRPPHRVRRPFIFFAPTGQGHPPGDMIRTIRRPCRHNAIEWRNMHDAATRFHPG